MTDVEVLRPLVDQLLERAALPIQREGAELFAALNAFEPMPRAPVAVVHELIPGEHWPLMLGDDAVRCVAADARALEFRLRRDLWADEHIQDDRPLWAQLYAYAALRETRGWGVDLRNESVGSAVTAYRPIPPFADGIDLGRLTYPEFEHDEPETGLRVERLSELVEGRLPVRVQPPEWGNHPFDWAVRMRGMEALLEDCALEPDKVRGLMAFITEAHIQHHRRREELGLVSCVPSPCGAYMVLDWAFFHVARWDVVTPRPRLSNQWAYVSSQTSSGLSPSMYEQLVHPYTSRLAALYGPRKVYYHGCESLDAKFALLGSLPNLGRVHVSPWSSPDVALQVFGRRVVLEVHCHPTAVLFTMSQRQMADDVRRKLELAGDARLDLNLNDIHSVGGGPDRLRMWADIAREASTEFGPR